MFLLGLPESRVLVMEPPSILSVSPVIRDVSEQVEASNKRTLNTQTKCEKSLARCIIFKKYIMLIFPMGDFLVSA